MKIKMRTAMVHPQYGVAQSGQVIDLPEAAAREMVAGGYAELIIDRRRPESAAMAGAPERAMQMRPDPRDRKPLPAAKEPEAKK